MTKYIVYTKEKGKIETNNYNEFDGLTLHGENGPAIQGFYYSGKLANEVYYLNNKRHRLDGPAFQSFYNNGKLEYESYYINGKYYTKTEYDAEIFKMKLALL